MVPIPRLSEEQRAHALDRAVQARHRRAHVKQSLKSGQIGLPEVFHMATEDPAVARMQVRILLQALPRVGEVSAHMIMSDIGIASTRRIGGLGPRQRRQLIQRFESNGK